MYKGGAPIEENNRHNLLSFVIFIIPWLSYISINLDKYISLNGTCNKYMWAFCPLSSLYTFDEWSFENIISN